jgi:hypothetical protein
MGVQSFVDAPARMTGETDAGQCLESKDSAKQVVPVQDDSSENRTNDLKDRLAVLKSKGAAALYRMEREQQRRIWAWSQNVIGKYAKKLSDPPRSVRNAAELSHSKAEIKLAIQLALMLHVHKGDENAIKLLRDRYLELASFQEIAAGDREKLQKKLTRKPADSGGGKDQLMPIYSKYAEIAAAERIRLLEEFNAFVTDLKKMQP